MHKEIRKLHKGDLVHVQNMQTNVEDDYVPRAFLNLIAQPNVLYGMFVDGQLVSVAGYTLFGGELAMLGRLRSDVRFHGHGYATEIMYYIREAAFQLPQVRWVGANTQAHNKPTHRVLEKIGFRKHLTAFGASTIDVTSLETNSTLWSKVDTLESKRYWLDEMYVKKEAFYPYECFYTLPATSNLFSGDAIENWMFYENQEQSRVVIMKPDEKKYTYVHVAYPWDDLMEQPGLWTTITKTQQEIAEQRNTDVFIWMDLSEEMVDNLPEDHPFELPSPWQLFGVFREELE